MTKQPSRTWILTAFGKDRPGLVAGVTKVLYELGCNLEDSAMTRLAGEFAIMLTCASPQRVTAARLDQALKTTARRLGLTIQAKPLSDVAHGPAGPRLFLVSVYGADRAGIVYRMSNLLAQSRVNITDVSTHRTAGKKPLYHLLLEVELPRRLDSRRLEPRLQALAKRLNVTVSLRPVEPAVL
jgi:glycine cleavage system transcriptional repressor